MSLNFKIKRPKWIPLWLNLPFLIFLAFILMLLFFGEYNYMKISKQKGEINNIKAQIKQKEDSAMLYEKKYHELNTDPENLEKLVREQYRMKRDNEDVYITNIK